MKSELHFCSFHFFRQPQDCPVLPPLRTRSRLNPCSALSPTLPHPTCLSLVSLDPTNPSQARSRYPHPPRFARIPLLFSASCFLRKRRVPSALYSVFTAPLAHWPQFADHVPKPPRRRYQIESRDPNPSHC